MRANKQYGHVRLETDHIKSVESNKLQLNNIVVGFFRTLNYHKIGVDVHCAHTQYCGKWEST